MELDEVTRWVDELRLGGTLVQLGAGMGWWTGLLAEKGELWVYDTDRASLEAARSRLMAHGLLAHLHERDVWSRPDKSVDVVFGAYLLGAAGAAEDVDRRLQTVMSWLRPGGSFVFIEAQGDSIMPGPDGQLVAWDAEALGGHLVAQGYGPVEVGSTRSAFVFGEALTPN
jgi:SAM-dependent methyltransferase